MANTSNPAARPAGASPAGGAPNRRKWLLPLIIGVITLVVVLLLLSRCGTDDKTGSTAGAGPTSNTAATTASGSAPDVNQTGAAPAEGGTVTVNSSDLLSAQTNISQGGHDGEQAVGHAVHVQSVPADEGFWVGTSTTDRLWVQLSGTHGESDYKVKQGDAIDFTGTVKAADNSFATSVGLTADEGAAQLTRQAHYISVPASSVKLFQ